MSIPRRRSHDRSLSPQQRGAELISRAFTITVERAVVWILNHCLIIVNATRLQRGDCRINRRTWTRLPHILIEFGGQRLVQSPYVHAVAFANRFGIVFITRKGTQLCTKSWGVVVYAHLERQVIMCSYWLWLSWRSCCCLPVRMGQWYLSSYFCIEIKRLVGTWDHE
jgi:hypothetical protein